MECIAGCGRNAQLNSNFCLICLGVMVGTPQEQVRKKKLAKDKRTIIRCCGCQKDLGVIFDAVLVKGTAHICDECRKHYDALKKEKETRPQDDGSSCPDWLMGIFGRPKK